MFGGGVEYGTPRDYGNHANIDDILEEFDASNEDNLSSGTRDLNDLTKSWIAERGAPEILPFQGTLVDRIMDRIRAQVRYFHTCHLVSVRMATREKLQVQRAEKLAPMLLCYRLDSFQLPYRDEVVCSASLKKYG